MVSPSSCALETMPRPLRKATTGASIISASSRISSRAWMAPLPTKIIGALLPATNAAAALIRSGSGFGAGKGANTFTGPTSARGVNTSHGISSDTGPRPRDSISWNARDTIGGGGSGHHAEHAGFSGGAGIAVGHVAAGLLMPRADHFQLRLMEGVEQAVDLRAGQAEHGVDAMRDETVDDGFAAGSQAHITFPSLMMFRRPRRCAKSRRLRPRPR